MLQRRFLPALELLEGRTLPSISPTLPVLTDPGFETPAVGNGAFQYQPAGSPWTFSGSAGLSGNGSAFTATNPNAPQGSQVAFLQGTGSVNQNVAFPAGIYAISLSAAQRGNSQASSQTFAVLVDGIAVGTFNNLTGTSYTPLTTTSFTVTAGSHLITFEGTDLNGMDNTVFVDQVAITASDFQTPSVGSGFQYKPTGSSWTFSGTSGLAGNGSAFTVNNPSALAGSQVAFVQSLGSITQSIVFAPGTYVLSFGAAQRGNYQTSAQTFQVLVDATVVGTFNDLTGTNYTPLMTTSFPVTAGCHTILFQGTNLSGGDNTVLLDQVQFTPTLTSLADSGFEMPALTSGGYEYNPGGSPWTFSAAGVAANGSAFTRDNPDAPQGNQVAFIQVGGSMSQSVLFPLGTFQISFSAAQRGSSQTSAQGLNVMIDGSTNIYSSFDKFGENHLTGTNYQTYTTSGFTVTPGRHTIAFEGTSYADNTVLIDQISIVPIALGPTDPGFETPAVSSGAYQYDPSESARTFSGYAGLAANRSAFTVDNANAPEGSQVAFLQQNGSISQSVTFPPESIYANYAIPMTYAISFSAAQRGSFQASAQTFEVLVDGAVVGIFNNLSGTSYSTLTTSSFMAFAGSHTITFQGTDLHGGDNTALIDQVSINPLPIGLSDADFLLPTEERFNYQYNPAASPWTFTGSAGVTGDISLFTNGNDEPPTGGPQAAFLQAVSSTSQTITFPAGTYTLGFYASQRRNLQASLQTFEVLLDGKVIGTFNNVPATPLYLPEATPSFTVTAGNHTVVFQGTDIYGGDNTIFITQIAIDPVVVGPHDPDFETPAVGYGLFQLDPASTTWAFSGTAGLAGNNSPITSGNAYAPAGTQLAFLQGTGSISQNITLPFGTYQVSFSAAQRANVPSNAETFQVMVDGNVVGSFNTFANISYTTLTTSSFTVGTGSHTLTFQGTNTSGTSDAILLDQVAINPLPPLDGSFEIPAQPQMSGYTYSPTGSPWTFSGTAGITGNGSAFTIFNPSAPEGSQLAFIQALGSISQSFTTLAPGTYTVTFSAAQRASSQASFQTFEVLLDGRVIGVFNNLTSTKYTALTTSSFTVAAGLHTLLFQGTDLNGGDNTVFLDQVMINPHT